MAVKSRINKALMIFFMRNPLSLFVAGRMVLGETAGNRGCLPCSCAWSGLVGD
jgi:hypothetical protein